MKGDEWQMISNSGHDENGKYSGGQAGDQTGNEWRIQAWYSRPWNYVLRHSSSTVRECIAELSEEAAQNDRIGYDQNQRTTFWKQLKESGYHPRNIKTKCEADCSAGVAAIVKASGYLLGLKDLQNVSEDMYTGNERLTLKKAGFQVLTDSKYLTSDKFLLRGDILLYENHHTAINITDGIGAQAGGWHWVKNSGEWYYQDNDGINSYGWKKIPESGGTKIHWYYFNKNGQMLKNAQKIDGKWCFFLPEGALEGALCKTDEYGYQHVWDI